MRMQAEVSACYKIGQQLFNINYIGDWQNGGSCGYCHSPNQSFSWGFTKQKMHPYTYQILLQRGWRRCGTYYYKPNLQKSCCKLWTHRMSVNQFQIKKNQRKTMRRVMKLISTQSSQKKAEDKKQTKNSEIMKQQKTKKNQSQIPKIHIDIMKQIIVNVSEIIFHNMEQFIEKFKDKFIYQQDKNKFQLKQCIDRIKYFVSQKSFEHDYYCNYIMLLFGINKKLFKKDYRSIDFVQDIRQWVQKIYKNKQMQHNDIRIIIQRSGYLLFKFPKNNQINNVKQMNQSKKIENKTHIKQQLGQKYVAKLAKQKKLNQSIKSEDNQTDDIMDFKISSEQIIFGSLIIRLFPAEVTQEAWAMYKKYCQKIHDKPEKSQSSYKNFLCLQSLNFIKQQNSTKCEDKYAPSWAPNKPQNVEGKRTKLMGCYHMNYYLKGNLIGVGVVDILPDCLSSVYFFYDPQYTDYRLGVFSSIIEIEYVKWMKLSFPQFKYYSMGFYIQNSQKMHYKADYQPCQLLCPITFQFVTVNDEIKGLITKIQKKQIQSVRLAHITTLYNPDLVFNTDIGLYVSQHLKLKINNKIIDLKQIQPRMAVVILQYIREYTKVWGKKVLDIFIFTV